jgi:hypothetical protein
MLARLLLPVVMNNDLIINYELVAEYEFYFSAIREGTAGPSGSNG